MDQVELIYFSKHKKAGDNNRDRHRTSFDWIWDIREWAEPKSVCLKAPVIWGEKKKKSDGENIGMHVKALHLFELQSGVWIDGTHWCGSRQARPSWGGRKTLISVEHSILSPLRAILLAESLNSADEIDLPPAASCCWSLIVSWPRHVSDSSSETTCQRGGKELEARRPALNYYNYVYFHESSTEQTEKKAAYI